MSEIERAIEYYKENEFYGRCNRTLHRLPQQRGGGGKVMEQDFTCKGCRNENESRNSYPCNICTRNDVIYGDQYHEQEDTDEG